MVICSSCNKYFEYQWEWRNLTYGAFQDCPDCGATTFISSHNFWRVFTWKQSLLIIIIEMILAPTVLILLYPLRIDDVIDIPILSMFDGVPTKNAYIAVFAIFILVWILNLYPLSQYKSMILRAYEKKEHKY